MLSVGLIGFGYSAATFHAPFLETVEGLSLTAIATSKPDKVAAQHPHTRLFTNADDLLADPGIDLVVITSPNTLHYSQTRAALQAGKHVVVEKPFTITSREADELVALAEQRGLMLSAYHNRRWDNDFLTLRRVIDSGLLGTIHDYEAHFDRYRPEVRDRWREHDLPGSGILYDLGPHLIDQALVLFGPPATVFADLRRQRPGAQATDSFHLVLDYEQCQVILSAGMLVRALGPHFTVHGDKGSFVKYGLDPQEDELKRGARPGGPNWGADPPDRYGTLTTEVGGLAIETRIPTEQGCYQAYYQGVADAILNRRPPPVPATQARDTIRVIELAIQGHEQGRRMDWS